MSFQKLGLSSTLLDAIAETGYSEPTSIQEQAVPAVLEGRDLLAAAQTGTGKTAAFTLPLLQNLGQHSKSKPRALVLTPTRELAAQVTESVKTYGGNTGLKSTVIYGGVGYNPQIAALKKGVDLIVATPGRLLDLLDNGKADLSGVETLVLDEADRMLDMGFIHSIRKIQKYLTSVRQRLLFSATFSKEIRKFASDLLNKPLEIDVAPRNSAAESVDQRVLLVEKSRKRAALSHLIKDGNWSQVLVFTRTKHGANRLAKNLATDGITAAALHGNKSQNARTQALASFKSFDTQALVATDIAARGIDINLLPHVVNFDMPSVPEDYVHRIGRTGRAGSNGEAVSLVGPDERKSLKAIEKLVGGQIERMTPPDIDLRSVEDDADNDPSEQKTDKSQQKPQQNKSKNGSRHRRAPNNANARQAQKTDNDQSQTKRRNKSGGSRQRNSGNNNQR